MSVGDIEGIETDVLVLGGGAAGHAAALTASDRGVRVMQLAKGAATTAISTGFLTFPVAGRFGRGELRKALTEVTGKGLCDLALLDRFLEEGPKEISAVIERCNILVDDAPRGLRARRAVGRRGRDLVGEDYSVKGIRDMTSVVMEFSATHGTSLFTGLLKAVTAAPIERVRGEALRILPEGPTVAAIIDGRPVSITAGAIVLATGGVQGLYEFTDNPPGIVGDGQALALEAGAALIDMEFIQFYPLALAEEGLPAIFIYPDFPPGGRIVNGSGEDLLQKHFDGAQTLGDFDNWDHLSVAMQREIMAGQTVHVDFSATDPTAWDEGSLTKLYLEKYIGNFRERLVRVAPIAHYTIGGVRTNVECETAVPGLYAIGEVAGGMHGANRHGGAALAEAVTFGCIAGRNAASRAQNRGSLTRPSIDFELSKYGRQFDVGAAMSALRHRSQLSLGPLRDKHSLAAMGESLVEWREEAEEFGWNDLAGGTRIAGYKRSLMLADVMRQFMMRRTESRGVHNRKDFPKSDDRWLKKQSMTFNCDGIATFDDLPV